MLGKFEMMYVGMETVNSKEGKVYHYAQLLQGADVKRVRVDDKDIVEISKLKECAKIEASILVREGYWNGKHFTSYEMKGFTELEKK